MTRYRFDEVRSALHKHWGLSLHRGGAMKFDEHDGRWDVVYSKTGFVVGGDLPGFGHGYRRFESLTAVVRACDLAALIRQTRQSVPQKWSIP